MLTPDDAARQLDEVRKALYEKSLFRFFKAAWPTIEGKKLKTSWHHEVICEHLEAVSRGEIRYLLIMVPPRSTKSTLCSIMFPAWVWIQEDGGTVSGPTTKFLCLSYNNVLARKIATTGRRLVMSEWYQRLWGNRVILQDDQRAIENFATTAGGERIASWMGAVTGMGGTRIIDDPHNTEQVESDVERERAIQFYDEALATRDEDPATTAELIIMQRLHSYDLAGHVMEKYPGKFTYVSIPQRFDARRCWVSQLRNPKIERDPRTEDRELFWPEHFPEHIVAEHEERLGPVAASGQYQQLPVPRGGNIIQREWWKTWPDDAEGLGDTRVAYACPRCKWADYIDTEYLEVLCPSCGTRARQIHPYPELSYRLITVDTAYGEGDGDAYSALTAWGVWHGKDEAPRAILTDAWHGRVRLRGDPKSREARLRKGLVETVHEYAVRRRTDLVLIERKTRGVDLHNELHRMTREWPYAMAYSNPGTGMGSAGGVSKRAKMMRLEACQPLFANGLVWAPDLDFAETVIEEVTTFPNGRSDDLLDCCTAALRYLRDRGMLQTDAEYRRSQTQATAYRGRSFSAAELYGVA